MSHYVWFGAGIAAITVATVIMLRSQRIDVGWLPVVAMVRAVVQLAVIAVLLQGILAVPATVVGFILLMFTTASWTAQQRLSELWHGRRAALIGVLVGGLVSLVVVFGLQLARFEPRYLVAIGGIIIGNAMGAATLTGRNFLRSSRTRTGEIEAWLAIGATPTQAHAEIGREAVRETMLPNLDQTKATGLVTLPGAFVGALLGGASPVQAAMFQLVVLTGLGFTSALTGLVVARLIGRSPVVPRAQE